MEDVLSVAIVFINRNGLLARRVDMLFPLQLNADLSVYGCITHYFMFCSA